jgi:hypothetical protein
MSVKSSTELMLYVVLTMPTLNKAYLFIMVIEKVNTIYRFHKLVFEETASLKQSVASITTRILRTNIF